MTQANTPSEAPPLNPPLLVDMKPTIEEKKQGWGKVYAVMSFSRASESCDLLLGLASSTDDALYSPLPAAVLIYYGRPFKNQNGATRLDATWVPSKYAAFHKGLLAARDK